MVKVITYGTYDLLHYGHIRLLEQAKALGDYLMVGVTADDFDKTRGKINIEQPLMERVEAVRATGLADEIIIEEYEGQKIDDIRRHNIDIFTVGSDWAGKFDYLSKYCRVVYLERTEGVSSSGERAQKRQIRLGLVGEAPLLNKVYNESKYVNGISVAGIYTEDASWLSAELRGLATGFGLDGLLGQADAVYIASHPSKHYGHIKRALEKEKDVLCESPIALKASEYDELMGLARRQGLVLMDAIKTAYSTAYNRLLLLTESGKIGDVVSVDATCTSMQEMLAAGAMENGKLWDSICGWGPTAMLPVLQILGTGYRERRAVSLFGEGAQPFGLFTKMDFVYGHAVASIKVGKGVKSEGDLVISGTKGYLYVPAPWWKTDYFEARFEDPADNRRYFYQLDGEGIRYELVAFAKAVGRHGADDTGYIGQDISREICEIVGECHSGGNVVEIQAREDLCCSSKKY